MNEALAGLPPLARILYLGLWCLADGDGRLEDRPRKIHVQVLPYEAFAVTERLLAVLANGKFITRYVVGEVAVIQIPNFDAEQPIHPREPRNGFPAPPITESLPPAPIAEASEPTTLPVSEKPKELVFDFEALWKRYPRREGRKQAQKHFKATVKTMKDWLDIQNALDNYLKQLAKNQTELQFTKAGATWFNNWRDYVDYHTDGRAILRAPAPPRKPVAPEPPPEELTFDDLKAMHDLKISALKKRCVVPGCEFCQREVAGRIPEERGINGHDDVG